MQHTPPPEWQRRAGVTLLELIVVIAILGLLAALVMPAVQQARETSRRMICQNHLHQLGLAIANAADASDAFPTSESPDAGLRRLLPYLDAAAIHDALSSQQTPDSFQIPVLACPADPVVLANMTAVSDSR